MDGQALFELTERQKERLVGNIKKELILSRAIADLDKSGCVGVEEEPKAVHTTSSSRPGPSHKPDDPEPQPIEEETSAVIDEIDVDRNILNPDDLGSYK